MKFKSSSFYTKNKRTKKKSQIDPQIFDIYRVNKKHLKKDKLKVHANEK